MTLPADVSLFEVMGVTGFVLYVINYGLLTIGRLSLDQAGYFILNWLAVTFVLIGLMSSFNLTSALIQVFWIAISSWGIYVRFGKKLATARTRWFKASPKGQLQPFGQSPIVLCWAGVFLRSGCPGRGCG